MKKEKNAPYPFVTTKKPFVMTLKEGIVSGCGDGHYFSRFTKPVPVKQGDRFFWNEKNGFILNGRQVPVKRHPPKKLVYKIGWAAKKIRLAVFPEGRHWIAADTRSYNVSQGDTAVDAIKSLILTLKAEDDMQRDEEKSGHKVIRWHVERTPGAKAEMAEMEEKARKNGLFLQAVEWR